MIEGLVDELGGLNEAILYLCNVTGLESSKIRVTEVRPEAVRLCPAFGIEVQHSDIPNVHYSLLDRQRFPFGDVLADAILGRMKTAAPTIDLRVPLCIADDMSTTVPGGGVSPYCGSMGFSPLGAYMLAAQNVLQLQNWLKF
jgi:hypothetical protein